MAPEKNTPPADEEAGWAEFDSLISDDEKPAPKDGASSQPAGATPRRLPRSSSHRASIYKVVDDSGNVNISSTTSFEGITVEDEKNFEEHKRLFHEYDVNNDGTLSVDEVFVIFENTFKVLEDGIKVRSIIQIVNVFSANNSGELNLFEFSTMMHFIEAHSGNDDSGKLSYAIEEYERSIQLTHNRLVEKLSPVMSILNIKNIESKESFDNKNTLDPEFNSVYGSSQMRCLALVSHNGMKESMMKFVLANKNCLKKFRLTGTNSTMTMLKDVFKGDDSVVFGPSCKSGPLGGDAQLVTMLCEEQLGGVIFFQDPLDSHSHSGDIESLNRNIQIYNVMNANNPTSAIMMMHTLRNGLEHGKPELLPSFFATLQSPSVRAYQARQTQVIEREIANAGI